MKVLIIIIWTIFMIGFHQNLHGQSRWINLYFGNENAVGEDIVEYYDHGYLLTGKHGQSYASFLWLIKTDINGLILWTKTFGEPNSWMGLYRMAIGTSGEIYLSGATSYYDTYRDPLIIKLDNCGEKEWCRVFNTPNHLDYAQSIVATSDGGCAVILRYTGTLPSQSEDRICLARFDSKGNLLWKQCYNSSDTNVVNQDSRHLLITPDDGFLITATCGYLDVDSTQMYWAKQYYIKTDSIGNFEWETVVHSDYNLAGGDAWTTTLDPTKTFYYSSVSHYYFETNFSSPALIKMDLQGNVVAIYDIVSGYINGGMAYAQFINDSVMAAACGWGNTEDDIKDYAVLIDTLGNLLDSTFLIQDIYQSTLNLCYDNKLVYMYNTYQNGQFDVYLRKLNYNLEDDTIYTLPFTYDSLCPYQIVSDTIVQDDCGLIVGIEEQEDEHGGMEAWGHGGLEVWPNPASSVIHGRLNLDDGRLNMDLELVIYDIFGREIQKIKILDGQEGFILNVEGFTPGVYIAILKKGFDLVESRKFVVAR